MDGAGTVGNPVAGTNAAISFGNHTQGSYTVVATSNLGGCTADMAGSATVTPSVAETCNGQDDDCNGMVDEGLVFSNYYTDADGDGYGSTTVVGNFCALPAGASANNTDCNDNNSNSYAIENWYGDLDSDGASSLFLLNFCGNGTEPYSNLTMTAPAPGTADCDDNNATIHPGGTETANCTDDNCNGAVDEGFPVSIVYVAADAAAGGDGTSWATAFQILQQGLDAVGACAATTQIWMKAGTYYPTRETYIGERSKRLDVTNNVSIYGGFAGSETALSGRTFAGATILSGDFNNTPMDASDDAEEIMLVKNSGTNAVFDHLNFKGASIFDNNTKSLLSIYTYSSAASMTFSYCNFEGNNGHDYGAVDIRTEGLQLSPTFEHCHFTGNTNIDGDGGAMSLSVINDPARLNLTVNNCTFSNNTANGGGAIAYKSSYFGTLNFVAANTVFESNSASSYHGGAIFFPLHGGNSTVTNATITDCTFKNNTAQEEGGAFAIRGGTGQNHTVMISRTKFLNNAGLSEKLNRF